jgi:hypothetical protein
MAILKSENHRQHKILKYNKSPGKVHRQLNYSLIVCGKVCLNSKFPPTLHSTLEIQPATLFGEKCVRLYLLGYLSISSFTTQNFRIRKRTKTFFFNAAS